METFADRAKPLAATAAEIARLQGASVEARVLGEASASMIHNGYDNYNGGVDLYTLLIEVPVPTYAELEDERDKLEESIRHRVSQLVRTEGGVAISNVVISPVVRQESHASYEPEVPDVSSRETVPTFWQQGYFRAFISHVSSQKVAAHRLKEALARYQIAAFVAHDDVEPTKEWQSEIESALRTMDALIAMITPGFPESRWCDQEVGYALGRGKLIVSLRIDADPHGFLGKSQGLQAKGLLPAVVAERLVGILVQNDLSRDRMTESLVDRLVNSQGWNSSRETVTLLEKAPHLNAVQVARLMRAIDENSEVGEAHTVPDRIRSLVARSGKSAA